MRSVALSVVLFGCDRPLPLAIEATAGAPPVALGESRGIVYRLAAGSA